MNDLQHEFIRQSVADLHSLAEKSRQHEHRNLPEELLREIFRVLHTIKGTSQVFGFSASAHLAHALENLLAVIKNAPLVQTDTALLAPEGVEMLAKTLAEKDFQIPAAFAAKIQQFAAAATDDKNVSGEDLDEFPAEIFAPLSAQEKSAVSAAFNSNKNVCVLEIGFEAPNFAEEFKQFRAALAENGEIIAVLPTARFAALGKIGFRFVYASNDVFETLVRDSRAEIVYRRDAANFTGLSGVLARVAAHGKELARRSGKKVEIDVSSSAELASSDLKIVFDALVHLVRNAVSHAFDERGKIIIEAKQTENNLTLTVADDGNGLNTEKIRRTAIEKNLVAENQILSAAETTNLIFAPSFSTADTVSDVSGRGVGLDAVKTAVENAGGKISVETKAGAGTTFEISLPVSISSRRANDEENKDGKNTFRQNNV